MQQTKNIIFILVQVILFACIKSYNPPIEGDEANKLVVSGRLTGMEGFQSVTVSRSSPVENAKFYPVTGCNASILDDRGNIFELAEAGNGKYEAWIGQEYLVSGRAYKVSVRTPEGEVIESAYDTLTQGAALDSVYYILEDIPTADPDVFSRGLQFYTDLKGTDSDSRFYKWEVLETWEFHAAHAAENYYDGKFHEIIPPDDSKMICWRTSMVKDIYVLSTKDLSQNVFYKHPLHFIDGHTSRLAIYYSMLVSQQSLSASTFRYFEVVKENSAGFGGLYEQQPFSISGNLVNLTNPEKDVLGYFYATTESSKRYFYHDIEGLELDFYNGCIEDHLPMSGWQGYQRHEYPIYFYFNEANELRILSDGCIDCRVIGGTLTKPDFWPL
jgi:hypothetical protein